MSDGYLTFDDGRIKLGPDYIDGILKSLMVRGAVRFDKAEQDNVSGTTKTPMGWEDADIILIVELLSDEEMTCYDRLSNLDDIFKGYDNGGNPKVYDITNSHLNARSINEVVFSGLETSETDEEDVILATLSFTENNPPIVEVEKPVIASDHAAGGMSVPTTTERAKSDNKIMVDAEGP